MADYSVIVIGGGPAGLAAAIQADKAGASVLLIEREASLGGILKQCIHDGFGLLRFKEKLSGPEYAGRFIDEFRERGIEAMTLTFVTRMAKENGVFRVTVVDREGVKTVTGDSVIFATGCRERTAKQVFIHGTRPSGVFTAGTAQNFTNIRGLMPAKKCVILGSGDIGLIMARRLTLEGAKVVGVYEIKSTPSGLARNIRQCLIDYDIPLYLSHTVTRVFGEDRLTAVEVAEVDDKLSPIPGTEQIIDCDSLILSVGLIPENELAKSVGVPLDRFTKGPVCDQNGETLVDGAFCCGNALQVNDLVDYVSESGETAGAAAAAPRKEARKLSQLEAGKGLLSLVPQRLDTRVPLTNVTVYFRSREVMGESLFTVKRGTEVIYSKKYPYLRPPEMEKLVLDLSAAGLTEGDKLTFEAEETA